MPQNHTKTHEIIWNPWFVLICAKSANRLQRFHLPNRQDVFMCWFQEAGCCPSHRKPQLLSFPRLGSIVLVGSCGTSIFLPSHAQTCPNHKKTSKILQVIWRITTICYNLSSPWDLAKFLLIFHETRLDKANTRDNFPFCFNSWFPVATLSFEFPLDWSPQMLSSCRNRTGSGPGS